MGGGNNKKNKGKGGKVEKGKKEIICLIENLERKTGKLEDKRKWKEKERESSPGEKK